MTNRLDLEPNFLLSHTHGRDPATDRLIESPPPGLQIVVPTCRVMESQTNLGLERKRVYRVIGVHQSQAKELDRNLASPHTAGLADGLRAATLEWERGLAWFEVRLIAAIRWWADPSRTTFLPTTTATIIDIQPDLSQLAPTAQMILVTILTNARDQASDPKVLVTENRCCFHDDVTTRQALIQAGVRYFAPASKFLQW